MLAEEATRLVMLMNDTIIARNCYTRCNNALINLRVASEQQTRDLSVRSFDIANAMMHKSPEMFNAFILLNDAQKNVILKNVAKFTKQNMERQ
jgi:hypothetical protein